jgi:periplasmic nitrate reductase NapE
LEAPGTASNTVSSETNSPRRRREIILFLLLAVVIWPFIAVGIVAGWGFVVWMYYILTGPPGPV